MSKKILFLALCALLLATACQKTPTGPDMPPPAPTAKAEPAGPAPSQLSTPELRIQAAEAWNNGQQARALALYTALARRPDASLDAQSLAFERAVWAALEVDDARQALNLTQEWQNADPEVARSWAWHNLYGRALTDLGMDAMFLEHFRTLANNPDAGSDLNQRAGVLLVEHAVKNGRYSAAADLLDGLLAKAPDLEARSKVEMDILRRIPLLPPELLTPLLPLAMDSEAFGLLALGAARGLSSTHPDLVRSSLQQLAPALQSLSDPDFRTLVESDLMAASGPMSGAVALALPLTGRYGSVGKRILDGARLALDRLAARDLGMLMPDLHVVNTAAEGWVSRLAKLQVTVIGGPLLVDDFKHLTQSGLHRSRAVFAFMPSLGQLVEGQDAWRFFNSPRDQINALLDLTSYELGLNLFGVLAPDERFGTGMAAEFQTAAALRGLQVMAEVRYPPSDPTQWGKAVKTLLYGEEAAEENGRPMEVPGDAPFQAVFVPDGLTQARQLAPLFHLHDAEDILLLGPDLWSRPGSTIASMERAYFQLSACPLAFDPKSEAPGARELMSAAQDANIEPVDFWTALGYDFVRFAALMGELSTPLDPDEINNRLSAAQGVEFSLAPLSWDALGQASQQMMVVRPSPKGPRAINPEKLLIRLTKARDRRMERVEALREEEEQKLLEQQATEGQPQ